MSLHIDNPSRPVLLALSDNGPRVTSESTVEFTALVVTTSTSAARPGVPDPSGWIESLFGHVKPERSSERLLSSLFAQIRSFELVFGLGLTDDLAAM